MNSIYFCVYFLASKQFHKFKYKFMAKLKVIIAMLNF